MPLKVAILGARGQLGSAIHRRITELTNWSVVALTSDDVDLARLNGIESLKGYIRDTDVLVNCAAFHKVDDCELNPALAMQVNGFAVGGMARFCTQAKKRLVTISTDYVFGIPTRSRPYNPTSPRGPVNVYGASKLLGENLAIAETQGHGLAIVRVASLFGHGGAARKGGNFVETMLRLAQEDKPIAVVDDQIMSPTYAEDAAVAIVELIGNEASGIFHAVNLGEPVSWFDFAVEVLRQVGRYPNPCKAAERPGLAARPSYSALTTSMIMRNWREALSSYMATRTGT